MSDAVDRARTILGAAQALVEAIKLERETMTVADARIATDLLREAEGWLKGARLELKV